MNIIGLSLQITIFLVKNTVLARVGVAGLNCLSSELLFYEGEHRFGIASYSFPEKKKVLARVGVPSLNIFSSKLQFCYGKT